MDSEPKRPIEELLEASAKTRREAFGSEPKMPNPMRARLHDEIARVQDAEPEASRSWLQMFWPRLAVAAAMATLLVIGPLMWWRGSNRDAMQVADQRATESSQLPEAATSADEAFVKGPGAAAAGSPNVNLADNRPATLQTEPTPAAAAEPSKDSDLWAAAPAAAAPPVVTKGLIMKEAGEAEAESATAAAAAPAAGLAKARTNQNRQAVTADEQKDQSLDGLNASSAADAISAKPAAQTQRFAQQNIGQNFRNTVSRRQVANILNNFEVQQLGNEIRLVDSDGSTYTGQLEPSEGAKERAAKRTYASPAERVRSEPVATRFRATGFNISLRKSVVFEGNLSQTSQTKTAPNESAKSEAKADETARIVGTARVNGEPPVEVDARPVPVERIER